MTVLVFPATGSPYYSFERFVRTGREGGFELGPRPRPGPRPPRDVYYGLPCVFGRVPGWVFYSTGWHVAVARLGNPKP